MKTLIGMYPVRKSAGTVTYLDRTCLWSFVLLCSEVVKASVEGNVEQK